MKKLIAASLGLALLAGVLVTGSAFGAGSLSATALQEQKAENQNNNSNHNSNRNSNRGANRDDHDSNNNANDNRNSGNKRRKGKHGNRRRNSVDD